jgi:uncharacterized membrane protein YhhN
MNEDVGVTGAAAVLLAVAAVAAAGDWVAVARRYKALEYLCKPAATAALVAVAATIDPSSGPRRTAVVVALVLSLTGDVLLMLPGDLFVAGLGAFLLAHIAYVAGFRLDAGPASELLLPAAAVLVVVAAVGRPVLRGVRRTDPAMAAPVTAYMLVIAAMVTAALASGEPLTGAGAAVFMASDSLIAWNRFVRPLRWAPVAIMVTYHLGQAGIVLSLAN